MAVEEDTRVFNRVKFDDDWPKAGAIDTAINYAIYMTEELQRRIAATVQGHIAPKANFTEATALFEAVLSQQGYVIVSTESLDDVNRKVQELISSSQQNAQHSAQVHEKLARCEEELDQALATICELQLAQPGEKTNQEQRDTFVVSQCFLPNPYSPTGEPCVLSHREDPHSSAKGGEFWTQQAGLSEEQARALKKFNDRQ